MIYTLHNEGAQSIQFDQHGITGSHELAREALKTLTAALAAANTPEADRIYRLYPRKVARPVALKAISKAIAKVGFPELMNRTAAYAAAVAGKDPQFIPHPATWFNQERYADDPATWGGPISEPVQSQRRGEFEDKISL